MFLRNLVSVAVVLAISNSASSLVDPNAHLFERLLPVFRAEDTRAFVNEPFPAFRGESVGNIEQAVDRIHRLVAKKILTEDKAKTLIQSLARAEHVKRFAKSLRDKIDEKKSHKSG
jgi:uncharacterized membrane protein YheB (UPF0754 family)